MTGSAIPWIPGFPWTRRRPLGEFVVIALALAVDLSVYGGDRALRWGGELAPWVVPVVAVVVLSTLLARWERPLAVVGVQWVHGLAGLALPGYAPVAGLLVALHAVACRTATRTSLAVLALAAVPLAVDNANAADGSPGRFAALCLAWAVVLTAVWAVGRRVHLADRRTARAEELREQRAAEAVRDERLRLARELHDIVAHAVSAMILQAAGARAVLAGAPADTGRDEVHDALVTVERSGVTAMKELHRLLGLLRAVTPDAPDDATTAPRLADLETLVDSSRRSGLDVDRVVEGAAGPLDRSVELAAYRVVQESLTNAVKHGGSGALLRIHEVWEPDRLRITARSTRGVASPTGPRPEMPTGGFGLRGLTERVALVGGRLDAGPTDDGFLVRAELPRDGGGSR